MIWIIDLHFLWSFCGAFNLLRCLSMIWVISARDCLLVTYERLLETLRNPASARHSHSHPASGARTSGLTKIDASLTQIIVRVADFRQRKCQFPIPQMVCYVPKYYNLYVGGVWNLFLSIDGYVMKLFPTWLDIMHYILFVLASQQAVNHSWVNVTCAVLYYMIQSIQKNTVMTHRKAPYVMSRGSGERTLLCQITVVGLLLECHHRKHSPHPRLPSPIIELDKRTIFSFCAIVKNTIYSLAECMCSTWLMIELVSPAIKVPIWHSSYHITFLF